MLTLTLALEGITLHGLLVLLGLGVYAAASHSTRQRRHPSAAIAWVISLVLIPYLALPLYLMFGRRKVVGYGRVRALRPARLAGDGMTPVYQAGQLDTAMGLPDTATFEELEIHRDGAHALQALLGLIAQARNTIDVCTFLLGRDPVGQEVSTALMRRAREGLQVRLLLDGVGYYMGGYPNTKPLVAAGVQLLLFVSPLRSALRGRTNLRNHRKMAIADGERLWCGGRNLAAEYFKGLPRHHHKTLPWVDLTFDLRGPLVQQALQRFETDWTFALSGKAVNPPSPRAPNQAGQQTGARLVASGPDQVDDTFYSLLVSGCFTARSRILVVTPYFVPDATLLMALTLAARRGIAVSLLIPARSNHRLADVARYSALRELAAAGAHIWRTPGMLHAKMVLFDEDKVLAGSANLDERSLFLNYELMVAFYDRPVVQLFADWFATQRALARSYDPRPPGLAREMVEGLVRWVAFQL
ncbi:MAG: phospholipase D-like domain-containing protein [Burkholderiaceae bacterium]